ncbi:late control protein D [Metarhizobium album]|uniref:Late control protein D n=1 Tax=Metarhizobium album TaxID=2182425 RepID=A0A2U2DQ74_9HYPH|nr:late control protein D [Rhizobium album]PWE55441.1 late control protein D [Rhizobium album]
MGIVSTSYQVIVAGQDVTSRFEPRLLSIKITRAADNAADECSIELADPYGDIVLPQDRAPVMININGDQAFMGFVSDVDYSFSKGDGRRMSVGASSVDLGSKVKEPFLKHKDDASLADVASEFGGRAGLQVSVAGSIKSIQRPYWLAQNESFMSWGQRIANEVGASFKIIGNRCYMVAINEGISVSGQTLTPIAVTYGVNLISGNIAPIISRPKFKNVEISYFDVKKGQRMKVDVPTGVDDVSSALRTVITASDEAQAKQQATTQGKKSDREKGGGSVTILGNVFAEPEALCNLSGIRPGIDGSYRIASVEHSLTKAAGFETTLNLKQPSGGAGVDTRGTRPSGSPAGPSPQIAPPAP